MFMLLNNVYLPQLPELPDLSDLPELPDPYLLPYFCLLPTTTGMQSELNLRYRI